MRERGDREVTADVYALALPLSLLVFALVAVAAVWLVVWSWRQAVRDRDEWDGLTSRDAFCDEMDRGR